MTYRMESAKPAPARKWGYSIDYDKEIANDEREISYLSSEACRAFAAVVEAKHVEGYPYAGQMQTADVLFYAPELHEALGLTKDEVRAFFVALEADDDKIPTLYGARQPGDWRVGDKVADRIGPDGLEPLHRWYVPRETARVDALKKAKARLSRHKRNKEKYG